MNVNLRGGFALIKKQVLIYFASRAFFWTLSLNWMITPLIYMFIWIVVAGSGSVSGFTGNDFIAYYVIFILVNQLTYPQSHWIVGEGIFNGTFSSWLLRPVPPVYEVIANDLAVKVVCMPFVAVFVVIAGFLFRVNFSFSLQNTLFFIPCLLFALILRFMTGYTIALLGLFTSRINSLLNINDTFVMFFAGQLVPTILLPDMLKDISVFLPYRYMIGFPIELLLGKLDHGRFLEGIFMQITWIIVMFFLHHFVWKKGLKRYTAVGG